MQRNAADGSRSRSEAARASSDAARGPATSRWTPQATGLGTRSDPAPAWPGSHPHPHVTPGHPQAAGSSPGGPPSARALRRPSRASIAAETRARNRALLLARILEKGPREDGAVALNPTAFVQAMLPHRETYATDPAGAPIEIPDGLGGTQRLLAPHVTSTNGDFSLVVRAGTRPGPDGIETFLSVERLTPEASRELRR